MKSVLIKEDDQELTIRIKKSDFDTEFLQHLLRRLEFEKLIKKADFDLDILTNLKTDFQSGWNEREAKYYSGNK